MNLKLLRLAGDDSENEEKMPRFKSQGVRPYRLEKRAVALADRDLAKTQFVSRLSGPSSWLYVDELDTVNVNIRNSFRIEEDKKLQEDNDEEIILNIQKIELTVGDVSAS